MAGRGNPDANTSPAGTGISPLLIATLQFTCQRSEILEAAVNHGGLDYEKMRQHLVSTTYDTIIGPVRFEKQSNVSTQPGISQIQNGTPELVYPPSIATSKFQPKTNWN